MIRKAPLFVALAAIVALLATLYLRTHGIGALPLEGPSGSAAARKAAPGGHPVIFILLNSQQAILVDQRWGFAEADNTSATPANPDFGKPLLRTPPTSVRVGVRVSF